MLKVLKSFFWDISRYSTLNMRRHVSRKRILIFSELHDILSEKRDLFDIKVEFKETGYENIDWIKLAEDRAKLHTLLNAVMKFMVH